MVTLSKGGQQGGRAEAGYFLICFPLSSAVDVGTGLWRMITQYIFAILENIGGCANDQRVSMPPQQEHMGGVTTRPQYLGILHLRLHRNGPYLGKNWPTTSGRKSSIFWVFCSKVDISFWHKGVSFWVFWDRGTTEIFRGPCRIGCLF
jgi:hypothetical protein